jgi:hypothetical protein
MRKFLVLLLSVLAALALTMAPASAIAPTSTTRDGGLHFVGSPDLTVVGDVASGFSLRATGEVAGAGTAATATLRADVSVTTGCINRGSQGQQPSGLERSTTTVAGSQTFQTRSGRGTFDVSTNTVGVGGRTCPDRMTPVLVSVTFSNILLTITSQTGTITATFADISRPA